MESVNERLEQRQRIKENIKSNLWYGVIAVSSLVALIFLPMLGSVLGLGFAIPNSVAGWIVYIASKLAGAILNVIIFISFCNQGKVNVKDDPQYKKALEILGRSKRSNYHPRSPKRYNAGLYGRKAPSIFFGSFMGLVAVTNAILTYNYVELIGYILVIIINIIFGIMQMLKAEEYWSQEFYDYALKIEEEEKI